MYGTKKTTFSHNLLKYCFCHYDNGGGRAGYLITINFERGLNTMNLRVILDCRIEELENKREHHLSEMRNLKEEVARCSAKIEELKNVQNLIEKTSKEEKKNTIQENIKKNTLKNILTDTDDAKRFNIFQDFTAKCGGERNYMKCRVKMPKLESVIHRKNRLWRSWKEFLEDYDMCTKREGRWSNILVK